VSEFTGNIDDAIIRCSDEVTAEHGALNESNAVCANSYSVIDTENWSTAVVDSNSVVSPILRTMDNDGDARARLFSVVNSEHAYCAQKTSGVKKLDYDHSYSSQNSNYALMQQNAGEHNLSEHESQISEDTWSNLSREIVNFDINYEAHALEQFCETEETLVSYLSGWVARKSVICVGCQDILTKRKCEHSYCTAPGDVFAAKKRYSDSSSSGLLTPSAELLRLIHTVEATFRLKFDDLDTQSNIAQSLYDVISPSCDFTFLFTLHPEHALYLSQKILKLYIVMRIFYAVKFANRELQCNTRRNKSVRGSEKSRKMQKICHK
jgi:hypothetical protein